MQKVIGTKVLSAPSGDALFNAVQPRIDANDSVAVWTYKKDKSVAWIEIHFTDEETVLSVAVDSHNLNELQSFIRTIDNYLLRKSQRS